jgi:L,D-transpeptidase catalytic domain
LIATADNATHQITMTRNGNVEQTFPMSMGKPGHDTPDGTYYVQDRFSDIVMDSATYGVPDDSPDGYRVHVHLAVQFDNSGKLRTQRAVVGGRLGQAQREPRLHQHQPVQRKVVLRKPRHRRCHRGDELRRQLHTKRRWPGLADLVRPD